MSGRPRWLERLGLPEKASERALWVAADSRAGFEAAAALLAELGARQPRLRLLLTSADEALLPWLAARFPACRAIAPPWPVPMLVNEYLHRSDIRLALFVGGSRLAVPGLLRGLERRAVPAVLADAPADGCRPASALLAAAERRLSLDGGAAVAEALRQIGEMLARDLKQSRDATRERWGPSRLLLELCHHPRWRHRLAWRVRRLDDLAALAEALGRPKSIMCLGNGPSSTDPALAGMARDRLFRVNHGWLRHGYLSDADVVFTTGRPSFKAIPKCIFGLQSEDGCARLIAARALDPRLGPAGFFDVHDVAPALAAFDWGHLRPTNGATMLATAVALRPARLIVAGIDLFQHPEGAYPGDAATANAYTPAHSRESELEFLLGLLAGFEGELVIVGDILSAAWARRRQEIGR
jgi:hypothetical protein